MLLSILWLHLCLRLILRHVSRRSSHLLMSTMRIEVEVRYSVSLGQGRAQVKMGVML